MKSSWIRLSSIRAKIILLPIVVILCVGFLVGVYKFLSVSEKQNVQLGKRSEKLADSILEEIFYQEKYINYQDQNLLEEYRAANKESKEMLSTVESLDLDSETGKITASLRDGMAAHSEVFAGMIADLESMNVAKHDYPDTIEKIGSSLNQIISGIDTEEAELNMFGELLENNKGALRGEIKSLLLINNRKIINLYNLLLFQDTHTYHKTSADLKKRGDLIASNVKTLRTFRKQHSQEPPRPER